MANLASMLKEEIQRLARKEVRKETKALQQAVSRYRTDIAALKRENAELAVPRKTGKETPGVIHRATRPSNDRSRSARRGRGRRALLPELAQEAPGEAGLLGRAVCRADRCLPPEHLQLGERQVHAPCCPA